MRVHTAVCTLGFIALAHGLTCRPARNLGCFADNGARVVSFLTSPPSGDKGLTLETCALACAADGFPVLGVTGHPGAAFCYCGPEANPAATPAPASCCAVPCPSNSSETCGGDGCSVAWAVDCDGPLPAPPLDPFGPALPPGRACSHPQTASLPFCNASLDVEARIADLVSRIAVTEIGPQLTARASPPIPRLGVPTFMWGTNALKGIADYAPCVQASGSGSGGAVCASSWPTGVAMAASFNASAWRAMGATTGIELRAYDNALWSQPGATTVGGLTAWGPTINIVRDPRWGRVQESASECPYLSGRFAVAVTEGLQYGLQGDPASSRFWLSVATLKHAFAYSLEDYTEPDGQSWERQTFNALVTPFDLVDSYYPAFHAALTKARAGGVMYAANEVNGVPCALSSEQDAMLEAWLAEAGSTHAAPLPFYRATDGGQIINAVVGHHFVPTLDQAIGYAVNASSDIADGTEYQGDLVRAIMNGNTTVAAAQRLLANTLRIRFKLGLFDAPGPDQPFLDYDYNDIATAAANASIATAAREGLVLLKNVNATLPFPRANGTAPISAGIVSVAVIGPNCDAMQVLGGNYLGAVCPNGPHGPLTDCHPSVYEAIVGSGYAPDATYTPGSTVSAVIDIGAAVAAANSAERVVLCLGLDQTLEAEQLDRYNITLPPAQQQLFEAVASAAAAGAKPLAVVLIHGGALAIPEVKAHQGVGAILDAFYPGVVSGGRSVADALFGEYNPGGKLPYTVYGPAYAQLVNMTDMAVAANSSAAAGIGRTYRYYEGPPDSVLWPFGFGLSYSTFALSWVQPAPPPVVTLSISGNSTQALPVAVSSIAGPDGDEVVQLYFTPVAGSFPPQLEPPFLPKRQLFGFERVRVAAGGQVTLAFTLAPADLTLTAADLSRHPLPGMYSVTVTRGAGGTDDLGLQVRLVP